MKNHRERSAPNNPDRHNQFQFGHNPMEMSEFEKELVRKEKQERIAAHDIYVLGLQGRDGGYCVKDRRPL